MNSARSLGSRCCNNPLLGGSRRERAGRACSAAAAAPALGRNAAHRRATVAPLDARIFRRPLEPQLLSDLLWAANGVNRPSGDRTAPYRRHIVVTDIYAAMADGVWFYEPKTHALLPHARDDIRAQTGSQDFVGGAPLDLVYAAHGERMTDVGPEERRLFASADACFIGRNLYLFCASEGLGTVRGSVDQLKLAATLNLPNGQFVTFAQTVGYPRA